jgi:hypothetical protein
MSAPRRQPEIIDINGHVRVTRDRAVLFESEDGDMAWLPLSQIEIAPSEDGRHSIATMPVWLAEERGFL